MTTKMSSALNAFWIIFFSYAFFLTILSFNLGALDNSFFYSVTFISTYLLSAGIYFYGTLNYINAKGLNLKWSLFGLLFPLGVFVLCLLQNQKGEKRSVLYRAILFGLWMLVIGLPITITLILMTMREPWIEPIEGVDLTPHYPLLEKNELTPEYSCYYYDDISYFVEKLDIYTISENILDDSKYLGYEKHKDDIDQLILDAEELLKVIDQSIQAPIKRVPSTDDYSAEIKYLGSFQDLSELFSVIISKDFKNKRYTKILDHMDMLSTLSGSLTHGGCLIDHLVSSTISYEILENLRKLSKQNFISKHQQLEILEFLEIHKSRISPMTEALSYEYLKVINFIKSLKYTKTPFQEDYHYMGEMEFNLFNILHTFRLSSEEEMIKNHSYLFAHLIKAVEFSETPYPINLQKATEIKGVWDLLKKRDPLGLLIANLFGTGFTFRINEDISFQKINYDFTKLFILLELYKNEHGNYPSNLSSLTPEYLVEIPKDPFNPKHETYQYNVGANLTWKLYSFGNDLTDNRGNYYTLMDTYDGEDFVLTSDEFEIRKQEHLEYLKEYGE